MADGGATVIVARCACMTRSHTRGFAVKTEGSMSVSSQPAYNVARRLPNMPMS